jgi:hypothetical protein
VGAILRLQYKDKKIYLVNSKAVRTERRPEVKEVYALIFDEDVAEKIDDTYSIFIKEDLYIKKLIFPLDREKDFLNGEEFCGYKFSKEILDKSIELSKDWFENENRK